MPLQAVDLALRFPPAARLFCTPCLGSLPAGELALGLVVSLWILPDLAFAVGGQGVDAGVDGAGFDAIILFG